MYAFATWSNYFSTKQFFRKVCYSKLTEYWILYNIHRKNTEKLHKPTFITCCLLLHQSHWGLDFNIWLLEGNKHLVHTDFLSFYPMSFSVPGFRSGSHIILNHHVSLSTCQLWQLLRLSGFLMTLTVWRSTGQVYNRMSLYCNLSVFIKIRLELQVWGRKVTEKRWHFHHIISRVHTVDVIYDYWCWSVTVDEPLATWLNCICQVSPL